MRRASLVALGLVTVWPAIYVTFFLGSVILGSGAIVANPLVEPLHVLTIVLVPMLLVFYVGHAARSDRLTQEQRLRWILFLFIAHFLAMIVYWSRVIWRHNSKPVVE